MTTNLSRTTETLLGENLIGLIGFHRGSGASWRDIAKIINDRTDNLLNISGATVRGWWVREQSRHPERKSA